jgi:hypothetical protein
VRAWVWRVQSAIQDLRGPRGCLTAELVMRERVKGGEKYCVSLHCRRRELCCRVCSRRIAFTCDHLGGWHRLRAVDLGDAPLPSLGERVKVRDVLLVGQTAGDMRGGLLVLQWALHSTNFSRVDILCLGRRVHGSRCQVA